MRFFNIFLTTTFKNRLLQLHLYKLFLPSVEHKP